MSLDHLDARKAYRARLDRHASSKTVSGFLSIVSKNGLIHEIAATAPGETEQAITPRSLVRISSLTKPIAAAATLALAERGRVNIDDPIERFIPELAGRRVLRRVDAPLDDTEPARRAITVRDLLTCTMGFGFPMTKGSHPVRPRRRGCNWAWVLPSLPRRMPQASGFGGSPRSR